MRFHDSISTSLDRDRALDELCEGAAGAFEGRTPDLGVLFMTAHHLPEGAELARVVGERTGVRHLIGGSAESLVGAGREIEDRAGLSLLLASLPDVSVETFTLEAEPTHEGFALSGLPHPLGGDAGAAKAVVLVGDPFSMPVDVLLRNFDEDHAGIPLVGGMASAARGPGQNLLLRDGETTRVGAVGAALSGPVTVRTVVSQGCRPIGKPHVVTRVEQNVIRELGGRPALVALKETLEGLDERERELFGQAPHLGIVIHEAQESFGRGDFLVRNLVWIDPKSGSIAVGELPRRGQTVQFHVRDGDAADEDLAEMLTRDCETAGEASGGLMFTCNGRGRRLFGVEDHDVSAVREVHPDLPMTGFFAAGEIGPVGGRNFLHGFTASLALFS